MPLLLLVDIRSVLYALVNVFHPDCLIRSNFRLRRSDSLHKDSHQSSWIYPRVKMCGRRIIIRASLLSTVTNFPYTCNLFWQPHNISKVGRLLGKALKIVRVWYGKLQITDYNVP